MSVVVDTSVWSLVLRRRIDGGEAERVEMGVLIREERVVMLGVVRQEILSGVRVREQFKKLRDRLREFPDLRLDAIDHENAASCFNECRGAGVQGSNSDFLICAVSLRRDLPIFTTDGDFRHFQRVLGIKLHDVRDDLA